ncbi:MAG: hypothetical protein ACE37I_09165 [Rubinisphaera brasiliensis]|uniref:hypothetical protein n=1 Tax=Rubinisphaera brasiliensis TaxID=119 RepID=UPI00391C10D4
MQPRRLPCFYVPEYKTMDVYLPDSPHLRNVIAILLGLMVSVIVVGTVEMVGHAAYPPPAGVDLEDPEQVQEMMANAPAPALLFVIAAWGLGLFAGVFVAAILGADQAGFCVSVLSLVFLSMVVMMLVQIPSPAWFSVGGIVILVPAGFAGWNLSQRLLNSWRSQREHAAASTEAEHHNAESIDEDGQDRTDA